MITDAQEFLVGLFLECGIPPSVEVLLASVVQPVGGAVPPPVPGSWSQQINLESFVAFIAAGAGLRVHLDRLQ